MTEEVKNDNGELPVNEPSIVEQNALAQGWVPKEEFQGEEHKWVDAGEFLRRGELFEKIESQSRQIKEMNKTLAGFKDHYTKVKETEYARALSTLKAQHKLANREGDFEKADLLEAEIENIQEQATKEKQSLETTQSATVHPEFQSWVFRNSWYSSQPHMKTFADIKGLEYAQTGMSPTEVLKKVELEVKKEFPHKFTNPNQNRQSTTESASSRGSPRSSGIELSEQERRVMNNLVKSGVMTEADYIKDLKNIKGIK